MNYPVEITSSLTSGSYTLLVPDLPGCKIQSESINEGMKKLNDVIASHLQILAEYGEKIPPAKTIDSYIESNVEVNKIWALIDFDIVPYLGKSHKINVTLPELLIKQIDDCVSKTAQYKTRSGFIAHACSNELAK